MDESPNGPTSSSEPTTHRMAWLVGGLIAAAIVVASSGADIHRTAFGDGEIYRYVALNLDIQPDDVDPVVEERGTSLRYGRIGLPAAIWLVAGGQPSAMPYAHALLMIVTGAAAAGAVASMLPGGGRSGPLLVWLAPGFPLSVAGGFADAPALALALWGTVLAARHRWLPATACFAAAILTKEGMAFVMVGAGVWLVVRRSKVGALILGAALLPTLAWYLVVRQRFGHIPILDPYLTEDTSTARAPILGAIESLSDPPSVKGWVSASIHLIATGMSAWLARVTPFALIGAVAGIQVLSAGPFAWNFIGESARVFVAVQAFLILAVVARFNPTWVARELRPTPQVS